MAAKLETISGMESYFHSLEKAGIRWNTKLRAATDVEVRITQYQWTVPDICFPDYFSEDAKIILSARIYQIYGAVFLTAIKALRRNNFTGNARELAWDILTGEVFWARLQKKGDALCEKYNITIKYFLNGIQLRTPNDINLQDTYIELSDEIIKAQTEEYQRQFIHSNLARICPWCRKYFIPSGPQAYKQIYCSESRRKGKGSKTERGCKEYAKDRRNYLKRKSTLTEGEKEELQRLSAKPELHTTFQWEAKIRQVLRRLGFPDNHGWVPVDKAEEVEILEKQLKS